MKLNKLQTRFFEEIIGAELDVPVHATLSYEGTTFDIIVVPEINSSGHFRLKFYNAPAYDPEPQIIGEGIFSKTLTMSEAFGLHPLLERAWQERAVVELELKLSQLPLQPKPNHTLSVRVLNAAAKHRGALVLDNNQATLKSSPLRKARFSISDFCDFLAPWSGIGSIVSISVADRQMLQSITDKLTDEAKITIRPGPNRIILNTGGGWNITVTKDENGTDDEISHSGVVERIDGGDFEVAELNHVLDGLHYFFAFTMSYYCFPSVVIGYDANDKIIWGQLGKFHSDRQRPMNWFNHGGDEPEGSYLERLFPKFWIKWIASKEEIVAVIDCYVKSNVMRRAGLPQDAVAKSCFGLEILASMIWGQPIDRNAAKVIDRVLRCYQIPERQFSGSSSLVLDQLRKNLNCSDDLGSSLIVAVRNYVAHPLDKNTPEVKAHFLQYLDSDPMQYVYLHDLSQFYLEYMFLRSCGLSIGCHRQLLEALN